MIQRVLVAVDDSEASRAAVDQAIRVAARCHARVRLAHLLDVTRLATAPQGELADPGASMREAGHRMLLGLRSRVAAAGVPVHALLVDGSGSSLVDVVNDKARAWRAELVVMGTRGRSSLKLQLDDNPGQAAALPVLRVRAPPANEHRRAASSPGRAGARGASLHQQARG